MVNGTPDAVELGHWAYPDAAHCACSGGGWVLSNWDTWHCCPYHGKGVPHPETESPSDDELLAEARARYQRYREWAADHGLTRAAFDAACRAAVAKDAAPDCWADAAENVYYDHLSDVDLVARFAERYGQHAF